MKATELASTSRRREHKVSLSQGKRELHYKGASSLHCCSSTGKTSLLTLPAPPARLFAQNRLLKPSSLTTGPCVYLGKV